MKTILGLLFTFFPFFTGATGEILPILPTQTNIDYSIDFEKELQKTFKNTVSINTPYTIDISSVINNLKIIYPEKDFHVVWNLKGGSSQNNPLFERNFKEKGEKEIELFVIEKIITYDEKETPKIEDKIWFSKTFSLLVFEKSFLLIYSQEIDKGAINSYVEFAKKDGIYVHKIGPLGKTDIEVTSIINTIESYQKEGGLKADYITLWGGRDFLLNIISKISGEISTNESMKGIKLGIVSLSSYNLDVLNNYLQNFLAHKNWINDLILLNENSKFFLLKYSSIQDLPHNLNENKYDYIDVNLSDTQVNKLFFISKFVNNLSNLGYTTQSIYLFFTIPIILTCIIIFKHFVGISPIGIVIPLFITLLFIKIGFWFGIFLLGLFILFNIISSIFISRYNLLYAPKMVFMMNINIIFFILCMNIGIHFNLISLSLGDIIFFILFILLSEKMIQIIISKDLLEYKESFFHTIFIALFCYFILSIPTIQIFIIAYPETILFLIPINFLIGKFSGLRITEYFRFKEIIKTVEE